MKNQLITTASGIALIFAGCGDNKFDGFTKGEDGLYYRFLKHDDGVQKVQEGDGITASYLIALQRNDSLILHSRDLSRDGSIYTKFLLGPSTFKGSLEDGFRLLSKGDSAEFIVRADSFFMKSMQMNEMPKGIGPSDHVKATVKIHDVVTKKEIEENQKMQMEERAKEMSERREKERPEIEKYLADNNIRTKPTSSGLYYIETKKGTGQKPGPEDVVVVHYTGKFLNGEVFDSSVERGEPAEFGLNQVIRGWTEALQMMREGGEAKLIVPSEIAYGEQGRSGIPPFSPLYFEVKLIDIKPQEKGQSQP